MNAPTMEPDQEPERSAKRSFTRSVTRSNPLRADGTQKLGRTLLGLALVWLCAGLLSPVRGAALARFDVFDVFIGYDGVVPEASWFPVVCEVENKGPSFNAIFELTSSQQSQTRQMVVELPTGTHKRFVIPVFSPNRYSGNWNARLLDEKGRARAEAFVRPVRNQTPWQVPLLGALPRTAAGRPVLPEPGGQRGDLKLEVARLQPELFPDNPIALEGLDAIYLNSEQALEDRLKVNQSNALLAWLHGGGHLIVGVEQVTHVNGTEWLRRLLPCDLNSLTMAPAHAELQEWLQSNQRIDGRQYAFVEQPSPPPPGRRVTVKSNPSQIPSPFANLPVDSRFEQEPMQIATGTLRDGRVVVGSDAAPLVVTARRGRGQITVLLFSPEREPFLSWKSRAHFWAKLANVPPELLTPNPQYRYVPYSIDGVFGAMIDSKQVRKLPVGWLLLLLLGYLAVIGPLDQYWLKRIGKQMFTWLTFPAYVAFFSVLIYFIGYKLRAGESEWNEMHVVDVIPVGEQADLRGRTFASVYSPANARYPLASELPFAALRGEFLGNAGGGREASRANLQQRGNNFVAEISVPVWTSQLYVNDWWNRGPLPLNVSVRGRGGDREVQVENRLDKPLTQAKLIVDGNVLELGDLPAKQTRTLKLTKGGQSLKNFVQSSGNQFQQAVQQRQQAFGGNRDAIPDIVKGAMAASFASFLHDQNQYSGFITPPGFDLSSLVDRGDAVLLAWAADYAPVKAINRFSPRRSHRDTLWRVAVTMPD